MSVATLIYNPIAGAVRLHDVIEIIANSWRRRGWRLTIQPTQYAGHATKLAKMAATANHTMVIATGGDGTLGEVADGLVGSDTILAPLPAGTGNSLAKEWNMPRPTYFHPERILYASDELAKGKVFAMDVGCSCYGSPEQQKTLHWLLWTGIGMDSFLVDEVEPRPKWSKRFGPVGYLGQALMAMPRFPGMNVTMNVDGNQISEEFMMVTVSNCRLFGGGELLLSPDAVMDDGIFEVWLFRGKGIPYAFKQLIDMKLGYHLNSVNASMIKAQHVEITTTPCLPFHTDGDPGGISPLSCFVKPRTLRVLVPPTAPQGIFQNKGECL